MVSQINIFLKTELTCIPKVLTKYFGDYYNSAICNGGTWLFVLWSILHGMFEKLMEIMLKKLKYREFARARLKSSLWYLGFYGTGLIYCGATLSQNEVELFNFKRMHVPSSSHMNTQVILGFTLICTFYLHSAFWEGLSKGSLLNMLKYLAVFLVFVSSYILRIVELPFSFTAVISVGQAALELTRCVFMSSTQDTFFAKVLATSVYIIAFATYLSVYCIIVPLSFVIPLGLKLLSDYPNMLLMFLFLNLLIWMGTEMYQSVLLKFINHWMYHKEVKEHANASTEILTDLVQVPECDMSLLECSLFKPRDDIAYNIRILRKEMQERKRKMVALRKPRNIFYQTLKCMVAVKKKLSEKRLFHTLKTGKSENDTIVNSKQIYQMDTENNVGGETQLEHEDESDEETLENTDIDNQELIKSRYNQFLGEYHYKLSESQTSDSDSEIDDSELSKSFNEPNSNLENEIDINK